MNQLDIIYAIIGVIIFCGGVIYCGYIKRLDHAPAFFFIGTMWPLAIGMGMLMGLIWSLYKFGEMFSAE